MITVNDKYKSLIECLEDYKFHQVYGGRSAGKSFASKVALLKYIQENEFKDAVFLNGDGLHASMYVEDFMLVITMLELEGFFTINKSTGSIYCKPTQSKITITNHRSYKKDFKRADIILLDDIEDKYAEYVIKEVDELKCENFVFVYNDPPKVIKEHFFINGKPNKFIKNTNYIYTSYKDNLDNMPADLIGFYEDYKKSHPNYYNDVILAKFK